MSNLLHWFLSTFFLSGCSDYNTLAVRRACRSKAKARDAFKINNLPYAKGKIFFNPLKAFKFSQKNGFPLVVKPNVGGFSRGAYFPIKNNTQLLKATILVKLFWPISVVEQYLVGKNYRIVITKYGIMSVIERHPPFVIGDGKQNINDLIDAENKIRNSMNLAPVINNIVKNSSIKKYLHQQKISLHYVPKNGDKVYLHNKISLKLGSSVEIINKKVLTKKNIENLTKILNFFNANILGIDLICEKGLNIDFNEQKSIFLELNSRPFLAMHEKPRYGETEDLSFFYEKLNKIQIDDSKNY